MDWAQDGTLSVGFTSGKVQDHDLRVKNSLVREWVAHDDRRVECLQWKGSELLATGGGDSMVKVWDRRSMTGSPITKMKHRSTVKVSPTLKEICRSPTLRPLIFSKPFPPGYRMVSLGYLNSSIRRWFEGCHHQHLERFCAFPWFIFHCLKFHPFFPLAIPFNVKLFNYESNSAVFYSRRSFSLMLTLVNEVSRTSLDSWNHFFRTFLLRTSNI